MSKCDAEIIVILWLHYLERGNSDYFSSPMTKFLFGYVESMVSVSGWDSCHGGGGILLLKWFDHTEGM